MNNDQPREDLASALFHATSASKLLVHAIQQRVHAEKIKDAFISPDGKNSFLDTYCRGIRDSWNDSRSGTESAEVLSLKAYCHIGRNIWTGFTSGYGNENHPSYLLYRTDRKNYPPQQSATSLPVNSLLSSIHQNCHVMQFRLSRDAAELKVIVNTPLFLDVEVPILNGSTTYPLQKRSASKPNATFRKNDGFPSGEAFYSETAVLAKLTRFMDQGLASDAFDTSMMSEEELLRSLSDHIYTRQFLKTSLECAAPIKDCSGIDLVTTAIVWPPLTAFNVIGMLYSSKPLCTSAIGYFATALPKMIPVCQVAATSLRTWESDGDLILAKLQEMRSPSVVKPEFVVAYWKKLWSEWLSRNPSGPNNSEAEVVVSSGDLLDAMNSDNPEPLSRAKTVVIGTIEQLRRENRLRYSFEISVRRPRRHVLHVKEL